MHISEKRGINAPQPLAMSNREANTLDIYHLERALESYKDPYTVASIIREAYQELQGSTE